MEYNFDDIRPYNDNEVSEKLNQLIKDPVFDRVLMYLFKYQPKVDMVKMQLGMIKTINQLQGTFVYDLLKRIIINTSDGLTCSGLEKLDKKKAYLFISNHRDIILDAALINYLMFEYGMNTTQIAIGNNLLLYEWIENTVRLNRAFIIKRNLPPRELLKASAKVSQYIRKSITKDNLSVWIAQREGRTKDGFDKTQVSVLKMLNMSNKNDLKQGLNELSIVPVSISYEIEPCGLAKIKELIKKEHYGLTKTSKDDLKSMSMGIFNPKGSMHFAFGNPVTIDFDKAETKEQENRQLNQLAEIIDNQIYANYKLWPYNYVAYDMLSQESRFRDKYSIHDKKLFTMMTEQALIHLDFPITDIRERFIKLYANPVFNKLKALKNI